MFNISNNNIITINAGDYFDFDFTINLGDNYDEEVYEMTENDEILFAIVEPNQPFEFGVVRKIFTYSDYDATTKTINIHLDSSDTVNLLPGRYYYEIKLRENNDEHPDGNYLTTVQSRRLFYIL